MNESRKELREKPLEKFREKMTKEINEESPGGFPEDILKFLKNS